MPLTSKVRIISSGGGLVTAFFADITAALGISHMIEPGKTP